MYQEKWMNKAVLLSEKGMENNHGGPFGAVIVKEGKVIGKGNNKVTSKNDPTAHAEIVAIREACGVLNTYDLSGCEIYSSCEPCPMCLSAIYWARIGKVYFANSREDAAAIGFDDAHIYDEVAKPIAERAIEMKQMASEAAKAVFQKWQAKMDKEHY